jgi:hypothetical protein
MPSPIDRAPWLLLTALALAGCAALPPAEPDTMPAQGPVAVPAPPPAPAPPAMAASAPRLPPPAEITGPRLLAWQDRLRELSAAELAREVARRDPPADAASTVELAMALLQARALAQAAGLPANGEHARVATLLEPVARAASPWQGAARLLQARAAGQRRLEEQLDKLQQQLREQQRRNEQLAAQIEALRAIERSLGGTRAPAASAPR